MSAADGTRCLCICYCECSREAHEQEPHRLSSSTVDDAGRVYETCYCTTFDLYDEDDADDCPVHPIEIWRD